MNRRDFLIASSSSVAAALAGVDKARAEQAGSSSSTSAPWRQFEVVTEVEIWPQDLPAKLWLPLPLSRDTEYQRTLDITWSDNAAATGIYRESKFGAPAYFAEWSDRTVTPKLQVTKRIATRNRSVDLSMPSGGVKAPDPQELDLYLEPTEHIPTSGIVRTTAQRILPMASRTATDRARAIYEWIVENTYRDPKVIGCGTGDIRFMLETGNMGGKCADLNSLFVGLARSVGIPARDVYGIRVADSATWKSLGKDGDITKAQHCRAEFYDERFGWVPVDPADVRKVILEEEPNRLLPLDDPRVRLAREKLFGSWEMNWMAFNTAGDTRLSPSTTKPLGHFMYPYAEGIKGPLNYYDPVNFQYRMTAREIKT
jgi:transglutaminase-like putative cysteine protease